MICSWLDLLKTSCLVFFYVQSCICAEAEIIGGNEVRPHSMPYMVLLLNSTGYPVCGGTLIHSSWVLTAAHCTDIKEVQVGVHSFKSTVRKSWQTRKVIKSIGHPRWGCKKKTHDLGLLKLDKEVKTTKAAKVMTLLKTIKDPADGTMCIVAGWGATKDRPLEMSSVLRSAKVTVIGREKCNKYYNSTPVITPEMVCAGSVNKKQADTCSGDSGGPLMCKAVQVGITSFGPNDCGRKDKPGVYTFLSKTHLDWIKENTRKQ